MTEKRKTHEAIEIVDTLETIDTSDETSITELTIGDNTVEMIERDWRTMELSPYPEDIDDNLFALQSAEICKDSEDNDSKLVLVDFDHLQHSTREEDQEIDLMQAEVANTDLTEHFTTDRVFETREELIEWAGRIGKETGCIIVIKKSDCSVSGRTPRLLLGCERGGKFRPHKKTSEKQDESKKRKRRSGTKKCDCPFVLRGLRLRGPADRWKVNVNCGRHNHPLAISSYGHSFGGKLTPVEEKVLLEMTINGVKPKQVLNVIKERDPKNASELKHIYNARARLRSVEKNGKSQMQQLLQLLDEYEYVEWNRRDHEGKAITGLFWAHPESVQLARCFPCVFIMNSTNKINKYRWPVFEVVGVTSTMMSFSVCFAMFEKEREDNYLWALERLRALLDKDTLPSVIVTNGEKSLTNNLEKIFPNAKRLLCRWHIEMNVLDKVKEFLDDNECKRFIDNWNHLILSSTTNEYGIRLETMEREFSDYPEVLSFIKETWLTHKELFVSAWTDCHMHLGCTSTSRIESAHAKLKRPIGKCSMFDFVGIWKVMNSMINEQMTAIRVSFERSLNSVKHDYRIFSLKEVRGCISREAIDLILAERNHTVSMEVNADSCMCVIHYTHGLPCMHKVAIYDREQRPIPLSCVHSFWKKLSGIPTLKDRGALDNSPEFQMFVKHYEESDDIQKKYLLKRLKELADSVSPWLVEPLEEIETDSQPKGRQYIKLLQFDSPAKQEPFVL